MNNLIDSINLIVTADHGMANVTDFARIDVDMDLYLIVSEDDVVWQVKPIAGFIGPYPTVTNVQRNQVNCREGRCRL